jgi:hypothetical protein
LAGLFLLLSSVPAAQAQAPFRKIGELELSLLGISASIQPESPIIPKNIPSGVRIVVRSGGVELPASAVERLLNGPFQVHAELSGPGLPQTLTLPVPETPVTDPLLLPFPGLGVAGDYRLTNTRIVVNGQTALGVSPEVAIVRIIDQVLVTSVKTRALTLDEIRERGIVLDSDAYLGFEFTLGLSLESNPVTLNFPVVFDRRGVPIPQPLLPPVAPPREGLQFKMPTLVPMMLERVSGPGDDDPSDDPPLALPDGTPVRIPGLLVIPGDVGYLKQHFAAQLFVANGAPGGSDLVLHDVTGKIALPPGPDGQPGTEDDPLTLPDTVNGPQPETLPVVGLGPDGEPGTADDDAVLSPGEQGQAEFTVRGETEGFHPIAFDIEASLEGLPTGPVTIHGKARGGVLVRNPYFDMTFTVPSVVRADEEFDMFVTVTNVGQGTGNLVTVTIDDLALSGAELLSDPSELIETLPPGDSRTIQYHFRSLLTGEVVASYLRFDTQGGPTPSGELKFTMGVGERGVALSPDTLVLPSSTLDLPPDVVRAAMRVLGQAWSVAQSPTLPSGVLPISGAMVKQKALAFAEAGLRKRLGQPEAAALRDLVFDFHGGDPRDDGFDQLLRQTQAGRNLDVALGKALAPSVGMPIAYEREAAEVASSGPDFLSFAVGRAGALDADVVLRDAAGNVTRSGASPLNGVPGATLVPLSGLADPSYLGLVTTPLSTGYTLEVLGRNSGESFELSVTVPRADGTFAHGTATLVAFGAGGKVRLALSPGADADELTLEIDGDGDGVYEETQPLQVTTLDSAGPSLVAAAIIGPETLSGASPFGYFGAMLFDRVVDPENAGDVSNYRIPKNRVEFAKRQLSGRIVFMALEQPEGEYVQTTLRAERIADLRGKVGPTATMELTSELLDPGAIVTGRLIRADGTPLPDVTVTYSNNKNFSCLGAVNTGVAAMPTDAMGFFEFRYVRQDQCGFPFRLDASDPQSGALRSVTGSVRTPGELIQLDIAFLGYGSVAGTVRKLDGAVAPGASVRVVSVTDPQVGGVATTDVDGRYLVPGITVGQVVVDAAFGTLLGHASGNIATAGATAQVDVVLDGLSNVSGTVYRLEGTVSTPVPGLPVLYYADGTLTGVDESDAQGRFEFLGMPAGPFQVKATLPTGEHGEIAGSVAPGQTLPGQNLVIQIQPDEEFGTLRGVVLNADLTPAAGAVVNVGAEGDFAAADGSFEITRVPVQPFQYQTVYARSASGLTFGSAQFQVNAPGQVVTGVEIRLSGLGSVEFLVLDPAGQPVANQLVRLGGFCGNPCGCNPRTTGPNGKVRYDNLPLGSVSAQSVRVLPEYTDVATGMASITQTTAPAQGVLRFNGIGTVQGTVLLPGTGADPAHGADVVLTAPHYFNDGVQVCGLVPTAAATRTDQEGHFEFGRVNVGPVQVVASSFVFPTPVGAQGNLTADGQTVSFTLRLVDTIAGELSGRVFLPDGTTPAGANVEVAVVGPVPEVKVRTDADGRYHFAPILPEGTYVATVRDPATGGVVEEHLYLPAGQPTLHDFRLKARGPVSVRVVEADNTPAESAFVRLTELEYPRRVFEGVADASNGSVVSFPGIYEGPITAEAFDVHGQGGRTSGTRPPGTDPVEIKVTLGATGTVRGHFLMPGGAPIPYGAVRLIAGGQVIAQTTTAGSGDVGSYLFDYVPAGPVRLEAQDPLTARTGFAVGSVGLDETLTLDVQAQALGRAQGLVTSNGTAAGGASVTVKSGSYQASTSTDGLGAYHIEGVPEGSVVATASYAGGFLQGSASGSLTTEDQTLTLNVALHDSGEVRGFVLPASGSDPAPLSLVTVQVAGWSQNVISGPDGSFQFAQVPTGLATLTADVLGSIDLGRTTTEIPAGGTVQANVVLNGVGALAGETVDSGSPIAGRLTLTGAGPFTWTRVLYIPADGQFSLPEVLAGPFTAQLVAQIGGFTLYGSGSGVVVPGQTTSIVVAVQDSGRVIGRVLRSDGTTPAYGANVTVQVTPGGASVTVPVDPLGNFEAVGVPLGTVTVRVADPATGGVALATGLSLLVDGATADAGTLVLDDTPVAVATVDPADGSIGVATNRPVYVAFTDPLSSASGISVKKGAVTVGAAATLSVDRLVVTLTPPAAWPDSSALDVVVSTSVTDVFGRHPAQVFTSRFTTVDLSAPAVTAVSPLNQAIQVPLSANVVVTFSEPLANTSPFDTLVRVAGPAGAVAGSTVLTGPATVTFAPAQPLQTDGAYTVTVNGAIDLSGNQQTQAFTSSFKTLDTIAPVLSLSSPGNGLWVKVPRPSITVLTNDGAGSGIDTATDSMLLDGAAVPVAANPGGMTHAPAADLAQGPHTVAASAADRAGNVGTLSGVGFGVDTVAPEAAHVLGVSEGQVLSGSVTLGGLADDPGSGAGTGSGVSRIDLLRDNVVFLALLPPYSQSYNTAGLSEGPHALAARATDVAGNVGPVGPAVNVVVDNVPVVVTITAPPAGAAFQDLVSVSATASQVVERMEFRVGSGPAVPDTAAPYQAVLDVTGVPEGPATLTVTAFGFGGETASATRGIVVDRTAPPAPDAARIRAEDSGDDTALVLGQSGSVESAARVEITNLDRHVTVTVTAAVDGSFAGHVAGALGNTLSVLAVDAAGNRSGAVLVAVEEGNASGQVPLTGLQMWLKAELGVERDAGNVVSAWRDQKPNGTPNDLLQAVTAARPLYVENAVGGNRPTVRFDGTNDYLQFTTRLTNIRTVFWVIRETPGTPAGTHFLLGDSIDYHFYPGSSTIWNAGNTSPLVRDGQLSIDSQGVDGLTTPRPQVMSVLSLVTNGNVNADSFSRDRGQGSGYWRGDLSELLIYDRPLSGAERKRVEDYLALKYALYLPQAAAPSISPDGGRFAGATTVTLSTTTPGAEIHYTLDGQEPDTTSPSYTDPFEISQSVTVKARAFLAPYPDSETSVASFVRDGDLSPLSFGGLRMWLRADAGVVADSSGRVSEWRDQSGNGADALQLASSGQPVRNPDVVGGLPALAFDGLNDFISFPRMTNVRTVFWVLRQDPAASAVPHFLLGDSTDFHFFAGNTTIWSGNTSPSIRSGQTRLNGTPVDGLATPRPTGMTIVSLVTTGNVSADNFSQDRALNSGFWWGDLAELVLYDRALAPSEVRSVEDYLALKYRPYPVPAGSPSFSPDGGTFTGRVEVTLSSTTPGAEIRYTTDHSEPTDTSSLYEGPITLTDTTTLKAKAFRPDLEPSVTGVATFERSDLFTPRSVPGLRLWVRPDAGMPTEGSHAALWLDQSGMGNDLFQLQGDRQPEIVPDAVNGWPALRFDGNDYLRFTSRLTNVRTVFWVIRQDSAANAVPHFLLGDSTDFHFYAGNTTIWSGNTSVNIRNGQTWINGTPVDGLMTPRPTAMSVISLVTTGNVSADTFSKDRGLDSGYWWGDLAELVIYDRPLTGPEHHDVEEYLRLKYAVVPGERAAVPRVTPNGGGFTDAATVSLATTTPGAEIRFTTDGSEPADTSELYQDPFLVTSTTTVKAKAFRADLQPSQTAVVTLFAAGEVTPSDLPSLALWVRADAGVERDGDRVSVWRDQSGLGNDLVHADLGMSLPSWASSVAGGLPGVRFDGQGEYLRFSNRLTTIRTVFWVIRQDPGANGVPHFLLGDSIDFHFFAGNTTIWSGNTSVNIRNGQTRLNGVLVNGTTTPRPTAMSVISLVTTGSVNADNLSKDRGGDSGYWWGDLAELAIFDRDLSPAEVTQVQQYLASRYGIAVQP